MEQVVSERVPRIAEEKRLESIERLKELLAQGVEGETKAEMMLRLADLYFQQGRYLYLREMEAFDRNTRSVLQRPRPATREACSPTTPAPGVAGEVDQALRADPAELPAVRPGRPGHVLPGQSALQDLGRAKRPSRLQEARQALPRQSSFVPDAYVLIGEYYFESTNNAFGALKAYQKATAFTDSPKYSFAMYKLAWCYYNVGDYGKAIDTMKAVVAYSMSQAEQTRTCSCRTRPSRTWSASSPTPAR